MDQHAKPSYLIFDTEAVADGELISKIRYPKESLKPDAAIARYRQELVAERGDGKDFIPHTFMLPISVAIGKVDAAFRLIDLTVLDSPAYRPHVITKKFWQGWTHYDRPPLVTFNGRGYDLPLMELAAFRYPHTRAIAAAIDWPGRATDESGLLGFEALIFGATTKPAGE